VAGAWKQYDMGFLNRSDHYDFTTIGRESKPFKTEPDIENQLIEVYRIFFNPKYISYEKAFVY
jgi:hypothetical protein